MASVHVSQQSKPSPIGSGYRLPAQIVAVSNCGQPSPRPSREGLMTADASPVQSLQGHRPFPARLGPKGRLILGSRRPPITS